MEDIFEVIAKLIVKSLRLLLDLFLYIIQDIILKLIEKVFIWIFRIIEVTSFFYGYLIFKIISLGDLPAFHPNMKNAMRDDFFWGIDEDEDEINSPLFEEIETDDLEDIFKVKIIGCICLVLSIILAYVYF